MKFNIRKHVLSSLLTTILLGGALIAQDQPRVGTRTLTLGGQDVTKKSDGLEITVLKQVPGGWVQAGTNEEFRAGDKVRVQFWSNLKGHVYFINIAPSGKQKVLYGKAIEKDMDYTLPARIDGREFFFEFDKEKGVEILKLMLSATPIKVFDDALNRTQGELGESAFEATKELAGNTGGAKQMEQVAIIQPPQPIGGCPRTREMKISCRSVGFGPPDPKSGKGAVVVAIPDKKNASGKLGKDEVIVVEIQLRHI